jgi:hypothetical protein
MRRNAWLAVLLSITSHLLFAQEASENVIDDQALLSESPLTESILSISVN